MMVGMKQLPKLLAFGLLLAGCGLGEYQAANAEFETEAAGDQPITVPLGRRSVDAYLLANQRALVLNPYDERGHAQLMSSLPMAAASEFTSSDIVIVEFDASYGVDEIDRQLLPYLQRGVVETVAYVAQTAFDENPEHFLITNMATIYPMAGTEETALRASAHEMGFTIESKQAYGSVAYQFIPVNPLQDPAETFSALIRLAELKLIDNNKTRSDLVETVHDKLR